MSQQQHQQQQPNQMVAPNFPQMMNPHQQQLTEMLGNMSLQSTMPNMTSMTQYPQQQMDAVQQPLYQQP